MGLFVRESVRIAVVQSRILQGEKDRNLQEAWALFDQALAEEPRLVCLTEAFASGVNFIILRQMAEPVPGGRVFRLLADRARAGGVHVAAGILELGDDGRVYDSAVLVGPDGALLAKYRRWMRWEGETNYVSQGGPIDAVVTPFGKVGLVVGYDLFFPRAFEHYFLQETDLVVCCGSIFEELGYDARQLCAARAMECHAYVALAGAVGEHQFANMHYTGGSRVTVDPYFLFKQLKEKPRPGCEVVAQMESGEGVIAADLRLDDLRKARKKLPFRGDLMRAVGAARPAEAAAEPALA